MDILVVKENLLRDPLPASTPRQTDKPDRPREEGKPSPAEVPKIDLPKSEETVQALTENINSFMKNMRYSIQFMLDKDHGRVVIKVVDGEGKLVRQIPPEAVVALSNRIGDSIGMVVNETVE